MLFRMDRRCPTITRALCPLRRGSKEEEETLTKFKTPQFMALASTLVGASLFSTAASAQDAATDGFALEEIVVTATKRASSIQDVPFSINAQTGEDIRRTGATSIEDLSRNVAGLTIQNLGPGQSQVSIRGVSAGQIVRDQPGVKEQVGVYLDESAISLSLFTPDLDFYDLARVETLRGPQGTLFGSGSIGGTLRYITAQPSFDGFEGSAEANLHMVDGGGEGGHIKGMVNVPLSDMAAIRAVAYHTEYAGFIDALREGGTIDNDVNSGNRTGGRVALTFKPSETVTITPRVVYQKIDMEGFNRQEVFNLYANPFTDASADGGRAPVTFEERQQFLLLDEGFEDDTLILDNVIELNLDGVDITSVTSYTDREILVSRDASALTGSVSVDLGFPDEAVMLPSNLRDTTWVESFTQELRLSSNGDGPFQWVVGGFYQKTDRDYQQFLPTPGYDAYTDAVLGDGTAAATSAGVGPADSPFYSELFYSLEQIAIFAEATYDVSDRLHLTAGGRYYDYSEDRTATQVGLFAAGIVDVQDPTSADGFSPRFMAAYDVSEEVTVNAQVSHGFRLGGVNDPLNTGLCSADDLETFGGFQDYDDETLWNYEVGVKVNTGKLQLNAAAFYTDMKNLQVTVDAGSCSSRVSFNVPEAHSMGIEAELKARPVEGLDISIAASVLESEFDTASDNPAITNAGISPGNRLASTPEFTLGANATYSFPFEIAGDGAEAYFSATVQHRGTMYTQPADQISSGSFASGLPFGGATGADVTLVDLELDSFTTANLAFGVMMENWEVIAYVNNITDENANLSFDRERGGRARLAYRTNNPRTFGLTLRTNF